MLSDTLETKINLLCGRPLYMDDETSELFAKKLSLSNCEALNSEVYAAISQAVNSELEFIRGLGQRRAWLYITNKLSDSGKEAE